jgi:hypothetical protein
VIDLPQPTGAELWPPEEPVPPARLNKPWRGLVAAVEVVLAAVAVWGVFWFWSGASVQVATTSDDGAVLVSQRLFGGMLAAAIGLGILSGILLVDAVRQLLLAVRTRAPKPKD